MYSWELEKFIKERNYLIGGDDLIKILSLEENPQITNITFSPERNLYTICDKDGISLEFNVMPYEEAEEKGLVRKLKIEDNV